MLNSLQLLVTMETPSLTFNLQPVRVCSASTQRGANWPNYTPEDHLMATTRIQGLTAEKVVYSEIFLINVFNNVRNKLVFSKCFVMLNILNVTLVTYENNNDVCFKSCQLMFCCLQAINYLLIQSWFKCHVNIQHGWIFCRSNSLSNVSSSLSQYLHDLVRAFSSRTEKIKENTIQPPTPSSLSEVDVASEANSGNSYLAVCLCSLFSVHLSVFHWQFI